MTPAIPPTEDSSDTVYGPALRQLRADRGWSLMDAVGELADLGYPFSRFQLGRIERNAKAHPFPRTVRALATLYGMTVAQFREYCRCVKSARSRADANNNNADT